VGQAESSSDQAAAGKDGLHLFRRRAGSDIEVLRSLAEQQIADAPADDECLETGLLQVADNLRRMGAELLEPDPVLGLGNDNELVNGDLRFYDRLNEAVALV
jgi:hypothetical protein